VSALGIDVGTSSTLVYQRRRGLVWHAPTLMTSRRESSRARLAPVMIGHEARSMIGRCPAELATVHPSGTVRSSISRRRARISPRCFRRHAGHGERLVRDLAGGVLPRPPRHRLRRQRAQRPYAGPGPGDTCPEQSYRAHPEARADAHPDRAADPAVVAIAELDLGAAKLDVDSCPIQLCPVELTGSTTGHVAG
jgi:hypothetical protein